MTETHSNAYETAQTCYVMAYPVLSWYVYNEPDKVVSELSKGLTGALFFYLMACELGKMEPDDEAIKAFTVSTGALDEKHDYYIIQYPSPPPVNLPDIDQIDPEKIMDELEKIVLAPYFSAMIMEKTSKDVNYFILGQSPDGFTTFRTVTPRENANLGRGCDPELEPFLQLIREYLRKYGFAQVSM